MNQIVYEYEDAFKKSLEYFNNDELAAKVFLDKYALRNKDLELVESSPEQMFDRVATEIARIEKKKFKNPISKEKIMEYMEGFKKIIPQGGPLSGIGNPYQYVSISNCFVIPAPLDSYAAILKADEDIVQISKRRGGVGLDLSNLRPKGTSTSNAARTSTGIIPFAERFSNTIREVGQEGRRGALILTLSVHHPEVLDFAAVKKDKEKVTGANLSIRLTDEFLNAVENDTEYEQRWPIDSAQPVISKMVSAREVWMQIAQMARDMAEPGLLFWDNILRESPADCYPGFQTQATNPCAELPLSPMDSCRLLIINPLTYVVNKFTKEAYFDYDSFYKDSQIAQRMSDNIIDLELEMIDRIIGKINNDPEPMDIKKNELQLWIKIREACANGRRTGTGVVAIGDTVAAMGIKYGSEESIEFISNVYKTLKLGCYRSSVDMAKEIGTFPVWDHNLEKNNPFLLRIKDEDPVLYEDMVKYGRRNIGCLTTAPTGSMAIETGTSSGIEPVFQLSYKRRKKINANDLNTKVDFIDDKGDEWQEFEVFHPQVAVWSKITGKTDIKESPWYGCCAEDINWKNRVRLQAAANKHVDHSISSTVNLPEDVTVEEVSDIYREAWKSGCKGLTIYRKNCRSGVLVDKDCGCRPNHICKSNAPKRPEALPCDIYHIKVKDEAYFVIIGLFNGKEPYEVFAGKNKLMKTELKKGLIKKVKRGKYALCDEDANEHCEIVYDDVNRFINEEQEVITRMISSNLRHGTPLEFLVHQLEKSEGDMQGFSKAISRVLKKYIKDGTKVTGEVCSKCGGDLTRQDGCSLCKSCGFSKCS